MAESLILVLKAFEPESPAFAQAALAPFLAATREARIVTFADLFPATEIDGRAVENWRGTVSYEEYCDKWRTAYEDVEQLFAALPGEARAILFPYFHVAADQLLRARFLKELLADGPAAILVPPDMAPAVAHTGAAIRREAPLRVPGLPSNIDARKLSWLAGRALAWPLRRLKRAEHAPAEPEVASDTQAPASEKPAVLIAVDDGLSAVNGRSAAKIAETIRESGRAEPVVITGTPAIAAAMEEMGVVHVGAKSLAHPVSPLRLLAALRTVRAALSAAPPFAPRSPGYPLFVKIMRGLLPQIVLFHRAIVASLEEVRRARDLRVVLAVNESSPLSIAAIEWARRAGLPSIGYWPALLGERPDCRFFPADRHLVYGEQIREAMLRSGVPEAKARSVGSVTFDEALGRSREDDIRLVRTDMLKHWREGEKLVVVGTEALPRPLEEIGPVVAALGAIEGVHIVIKVHPVDSLAFYERFAASTGLGTRIEVVGPCALNALLGAADLLVCVLSNIIVTAAQLGTPTLVCDFSNKRAPLDFVAEGMCVGCFAPERAGAMLREFLEGGELRQEAERRMRAAISRFNADNDGNSHLRVLEEVLERLGAPGGERP